MFKILIYTSLDHLKRNLFLENPLVSAFLVDLVAHNPKRSLSKVAHISAIVSDSMPDVDRKNITLESDALVFVKETGVYLLGKDYITYLGTRSSGSLI